VIKLYRASSRMEIAPGQAVLIEWICPERQQPVAPYKQLIWGYQGLDQAERLYAQARVDELLTESELQELRAYLARQGDSLEVEEAALPLRGSGPELLPIGVMATVMGYEAQVLEPGPGSGLSIELWGMYELPGLAPAAM